MAILLEVEHRDNSHVTIGSPAYYVPLDCDVPIRIKCIVGFGGRERGAREQEQKQDDGSAELGHEAAGRVQGRRLHS